MSNFIESEDFVLPSQARDDLALRLKEACFVKSLRLKLRGDALDGGKEFSQRLLALKKRGVKITHDFSIKLDFPNRISRKEAFSLIEDMPKPINGTIKVSVELDDK